MMGDRQAAFRREYRAGIRGWYNGYRHIAVIYAIGLTALWVHLQHIGDVRADTVPMLLEKLEEVQ